MRSVPHCGPPTDIDIQRSIDQSDFREPGAGKMHQDTIRKPRLHALSARDRQRFGLRCRAIGPGPCSVLVVTALLIAVPFAAAQRGGIAIKDVTVLVGDGQRIAHANVFFQRGKIASVGNETELPKSAVRIAGDGKFVTPGLIDCWSTLGLRASQAGRSAWSKAADAFDRYAKEEIEAALRQGVTTVYLPARTFNGVGGYGAAVRLRADGALEPIVLDDEVVLCAALGLDAGQGPLGRVKAAAELRALWRGAVEYRRAWEDYRDDLEEYGRKLKEKAEQKEDGAKKSAKKGTTQRAGRKGPERGAGAARAAKKGKEKPPGERDKKRDAGKKSKDELKKPEPPKKDRGKETLLRVLDGELALRVEVYRPEDILNVLAITDEFNIALILEGASGAHHVAELLADRSIPVVLGGAAPPVQFSAGPLQHHRADAAARLAAAGVEVYFGSGPGREGASPTRHLALRAAREAGHGFDNDAALTVLTSGAARLLGLEARIGRVRRGLSADLVLWSAHPFAPGARVERVFVGGVEVYRADDAEDSE